ncbi:MAG: sulfatase, partial [Phycisphaeraceae bacterium]
MSEASPLNVLYIHGDGAGRFVEPHGFAVPTPNLSQLASEGVMFRNAFCTAPTCSPSRASLYCGNSPSRNGMHGLTPRGWWFRDERETLHDHLQHNGYQTVYAASPDFVQFGWDWKLIESHGGCKNEKELAAEVVEFLRHEASAAQPFFMSAGVGFPKGRERGLLPEGAAPVDRESVRPPLYYPDTPATREDWARQIDATRLMDAYVGEVLRALDESGLAENTLVLCTTDHGPGMPWMKGYPNDAGLGTFFIMRGPSGFSGGRRFDQLVSQIDFFPTVCELAGLPIPSWVEGASLLPLVRGWSEQLHEALFAETTYHYSYCPSRSVRTERYRYVRWYHQHPASMMATSDGGPIKDMLLEAEAAARPVPHEALY